MTAESDDLGHRWSDVGDRHVARDSAALLHHARPVEDERDTQEVVPGTCVDGAGGRPDIARLARDQQNVR
jgi:hypothetical protein